MTYKIKPMIMGNPDRNQDPNKPLFGLKRQTITAITLDDLKEKVWDWQIDNGIGAGNWGTSPVIRNNKIVGYMSYNGRVWDRNDWLPTAKEIKE